MQNNNCFKACIISEDNITPKNGNSLFAEVGKKKKTHHNICIYKKQIDMLFLDIQ